MKRAVPFIVGGLIVLTGLKIADTADIASVRQPLAGKIIVIDPGHATKNLDGKIINPGAHARHGIEERDAVLQVALKLEPLLEAQGARVYMTRTAGNIWRYTGQSRHADNRSRAIFANSMHADVYVRLHCDWNRNRKFRGFTTYYYRWGSRRLARALRKGLADALPGHVDHGLHRRTFVSVTSSMPSVLLELGVLSYKDEGKELETDGFQTRLAQGISSGLVDYFQGGPKREKPAVVTPPAAVSLSTTTAVAVPAVSTKTISTPAVVPSTAPVAH